MYAVSIILKCSAYVIFMEPEAKVKLQ